MERTTRCLVLALLVVSSSLAFAQSIPETIDEDDLAAMIGKLEFKKIDQLPSQARFAIAAEAGASTSPSAVSPIIRSVPHFSRSFTFQGTVFPYTMVGHDPRRGETTIVRTSIVPISFRFEDVVDQNGNDIVIDAAPILDNAIESPNFEPVSYGTGTTQFADAIQRAEFFQVMDEDWHTLLREPRMLTPVQVEVPRGLAKVVRVKSTGKFYALIDYNFMFSQLNTISQLEGLRVDELAIGLVRNALFYSNGDPKQCCIPGFHTAFETKQVGNVHFLQTAAFAAYFDPGLGVKPSISDVQVLSHEISEWMNDPFVNNSAPPWQFPGAVPEQCQSNLETGDPAEGHTFPVTLHDFTYHPQTEALLQWFSRENPSTAFGGAYSYPNPSVLTSPSLACTLP